MELQDTGFFGFTEELPLFCPVVRGAKSAKEALIRCEEEMNRRIRLIQTSGAGKLEAYRSRSDQQTEPLSPLLIEVDELGAWMASEEQTELEDRICALTQTGYGTGIHLLLGTGHPTREVLTARIRASVPSRIALAVDSRQESELILGFPGAETLKGSGCCSIPTHQRRIHRLSCVGKAARLPGFSEAGEENGLIRTGMPNASWKE